jgi:pyrroline-5-carboxylate reductase
MPSPVSTVSSPPRIAFIGGGNMARSLIGGLIDGGMRRGMIAVGEPDAALAAGLIHDFGIVATSDNTAAVRDTPTWVLAVKPQVIKSVCASLQAAAQREQPLIISIAAGIRVEQIERWLGGGIAVVRCMPNTPALIGAGANGLYANVRTSVEQRDQAERVLGTVGTTTWIDEQAQMDTVTAISGSGPAYFFLLAEALEDAAVAQGMPRAKARALAAQTCLGAGRMLTEDAAAPAELRQRVTSAGGTTQAALDSFAANGFGDIVARAVAAATQRGRELSAHFDD